MRPWNLAIVAASVLILVALLPGGVAPARAQSGGEYDLTWSTVDGGGYTFSAGGDYALGGTTGQPDAGEMAGGNYSLSGGFWAGADLGLPYTSYLPLVLRQ